MLYGVPTDLTELLGKVESQLISQTTLPPERVLTTLETETDFDLDPVSDQWVTVAPSRFPIDSAQVAGGGNLSMKTDGQLDITLFSRLEVDWEKVDKEALTNATDGILAMWRRVLKAMQLFVPKNAAGDALTVQPMRLLPNGWTIKPRTARSKWLRITSSWECKFVQKL